MLCLPPEDAIRKAGSAGKPYPYVDVARSATRRRAAGRAGRTSSPATGGTPRRPRRCSRDGWLHTGDIAEVDDEGCYRIRGRLKDMYISGGENVYPAEVESVLHEHPAVARRRRRRRAGRALGRGRRRVRRAAPRAGRATTSCVEHCRERLARFKVPKRVPLRRRAAACSAMNKVLKDELRGARSCRRCRRDRSRAPSPTGVDGKDARRAAAPRRASACSTRPRASSPSSATTTPRS